METDIAIQRSAEKWAAGESLYEQPEKVAFIYRSQNKRMVNPCPGYVKPSRSYDNELETSVYRTADEDSGVNRVHDDLSVGFGNDFEMDQLMLDDSPVHSGSKWFSSSVDERFSSKEKYLDIGDGRRGHKKTRWKQKQEFGEALSDIPKDMDLATSPQTDFWFQEIQEQNVPIAHDDDRHRTVPTQFHLNRDQFPISRPSLPCKRPINLSSQMSASSSLSSSPKEKPSSFVIVEVKDGPTFFYKQSDRMMSDSAINDDFMAPSHYLASRSSGRLSLSASKESHFTNPTRNPPFCAYPGSITFNKPDCSSFKKPDCSTFNYFRRNSSSSLYHPESLSSDYSQKSRSTSTISQLPKAPGLRRPDLSVLCSPNKKRDPILEEGTFSWVKGCERVHLVGEEEYMGKEPPSLVKTPLHQDSSFASSLVTSLHNNNDQLHMRTQANKAANFDQPQTSNLFQNLGENQTAKDPQNTGPEFNTAKMQNVFHFKKTVGHPDLAEPENSILRQINTRSITDIQSQNINHVNTVEPPKFIHSQRDIQYQNMDLHKIADQSKDVAPSLISMVEPVLKTQQSHFVVPSFENNPSLQTQKFVVPGNCPYDPSLGFQNTSEIVQQKAGIKHDDIVVGPRRLRSGLIRGQLEHGTMLQYTQANSMSGKDYDPASSISPKLNLSASVDGLVCGATNVIAENEKLRRKYTQSESDSYAADIPTMRSKPEQHTLKISITTKEDLIDTNHNEAKGKTICAAEHEGKYSQIDNQHFTNTKDVSGDDFEKYARVNNKKDTHRTENDKHHFSFDGSKSRTLNLLASTEASYTKSLDRCLKSTGEAKDLSKSTKQQHCSKSSSSTPSKKLSVNSKLHMLSNIPVPISHDPPARRCRPVSSPEVPETNVPSQPFENMSEVSHSAKVSQNPEAETPKEISKETPVPYPIHLQFKPPIQCNTETTVENLVHDIQTSSQADSSMKSTNFKGLELKAHAIESETNTVLATNATDKDSSISNVIKNRPPADAIETNTIIEESTPTPPNNIPAKPRLHRSTEQLLGDAKLTVCNSEECVPSFENLEASNNRPFPDGARLEKAGLDRITSLKKASNELPRSGILRRGSDRTDMYRRGSDKGFLIISNNDPSVEDLKKASSLQELCQSMASLLNIDNVKAAEMITTSLSNRQDLVEGLDADAIMDYLSHHGVLDPGILIGLDGKATVAQRNSAIIRHVEEHGNTAVALFINALRQSGQLHLASSLDTEQRIKPVSGNTYFGKDRHKGEITIKIEIESLKIIAPREPRYDMIVDTSLLSSPGRQTDDTGFFVRDATDDEDSVKPRSCWCFCFSYKSNIKALSKKASGKQKSQSASPDNESKPLDEAEQKELARKTHRTKSQEKAHSGQQIHP